MHIKGNRAILVIHGIGQQKPYETLDSFVRGICNTCYNQDLKLQHLVFDNAENKKKGSFVRIRQGESFIDVYEYYWSNLTESQITDKEITIGYYKL